MNNLSAFTDVINGIRQAIFNINSQVIQLRTQLEEVKNRDTITDYSTFKTTTETKLADFSSVSVDVQQLKQSINDIDTQLSECICKCNASHSITQAEVQEMIDKSLSQLLAGVQPLNSICVENDESLASIQSPVVLIEPPTIPLVETPTVPDTNDEPNTPEVSKKPNRRSYKKKA